LVVNTCAATATIETTQGPINHFGGSNFGVSIIPSLESPTAAPALGLLQSLLKGDDVEIRVVASSRLG
jgi:hypothetical protein